MLHNKINRNSVVSCARDDQIRVTDGRVDKISEWIFNKFIVLRKNADNSPASLSSISFDSSTQPDIIYNYGIQIPSQLMNIL